MENRYLGCLLGLACGDAVGTTVEFRSRGSFPAVTGMQGGGPFGLQPGQWTDDTSMALCLAASLIEKGGFDPLDQMERYCRWWQEGYMSSTGRCFDIGNTTAAALRRFKQTGNPLSGASDPRSAGNGSLMRLAPVPMAYAGDLDQVIHFAAESSRTTHAAQEAVEACILFGVQLALAIHGHEKTVVLCEALPAIQERHISLSPAIEAIAKGDYQNKHQNAVRGSGYAVHSLEAALWCFWKTESFEDAVLLAANLGDDADTTAAICGQIAGAFYGAQGIPSGWSDQLFMREEIEAMAGSLYRISQKPND